MEDSQYWDELSGSLTQEKFQKEERLKKLKTVKSNLDFHYTDSVRTINMHIGLAKDYLMDAIENSIFSVNNLEELDDLRLRETDEDTELGSAKADIQREIQMLEEDIDSLETDIRTANTNYLLKRNEEEAEKQKEI